VAQARAAACEVLGFVGLGHLAQAPAAGLPLALRKRLELAKALATQPKVLLLDEVMAGLNPTEVDELIAFIRQINAQGVSILLIEHVMRGVMALAQRVLVINYGQMIAQGTPAEVVGNQEVVEAYLGRGLAHA
jgi:branched-chain amino acid transport system ATP-binding protein